MSENLKDYTQRANALAKDLFEKLSDFINTHSEPWLSVDAEAEPKRAAVEKHLWGKALLCALAQQLGIIEAALVVGDEVPMHEVVAVRERWIQEGHRLCMEVIEAQAAEDKEN